MGRWAQRTRRGGGPGTRPPATITIDAAEIIDIAGGLVRFYFSAPVDSGTWDFTDFLIDVGAGFVAADSLSNFDADKVDAASVGWETLLADGQEWQYIGDEPDIVTPQTGQIVL
jgi:hypothetical protein